MSFVSVYECDRCKKRKQLLEDDNNYRLPKGWVSLNDDTDTVLDEHLCDECVDAPASKRDTEVQALQEILKGIDYFSTCERCRLNMELVEGVRGKLKQEQLKRRKKKPSEEATK